VNRTTTVNVTNINVYRNVSVRNAVVGVSADRFGRQHERPQRIADADVRQLTPVRGALDVKPIPASVTVSRGTAARPPAAFEERRAVATRRPHDTAATLQAQGIATTHAPEAATTPRIVPSPRSERGTERAAIPQSGGPGRDQRQDRGAPQSQPTPSQPSAAPTPPARGERQDRGARGERVQPPVPAPPQRQSAPPQQAAPSPQQPAPGQPHATSPQRQAVPPSPPRVEPQERGQQPPAPGPQRQSAPVGPQQPPSRTAPATNGSERQERGDRQNRDARPDGGPRPERMERQDRSERQGPDRGDNQRRPERQQRAERQDRPDR